MPNVTNLSSLRACFQHRCELVEPLTAWVSKHITECEWNDDATEWKNRPSLCHTCLSRVKYPGSTCEISGKIIWEDETIVWHQMPRVAQIVSLATAENNRPQIRFWKQRSQGPHPSIVTRITHSWKLLLNSSVVSHRFDPYTPTPSTGNLWWSDKC